MNRICSFILFIVLLQSCNQNPNQGATGAVASSNTEVDSLLYQGEQNLSSGQPDLVIGALENLLSGQTQNLPPEKVAEATYLLARCYYTYEENELALNKISEAYHLFNTLDQPDKVIEVLTLKGEMAFFLNDYLLADSCFQKVIELASLEKKYEAIFDALVKRSSLPLSTNNSLQLLEKASRVAKTAKDTLKIIQVGQLLATEHEARGNLTQAEKHYLDILSLSDTASKDITLITDIRSLGSVYEKSGLFNQAQQQYIRALDIADHNKDTLLLIELHTEISNLFIQSRLWEKAEEYALKAIQTIEELNTSPQQTLALNFNYLGQIKEQQNDIQSAQQYYRRSLDLFQQLGDHLNSAKLHLQLGYLENAPDRFGKALQAYEKALALKEANNEKVGIMQVKLSIANILILQGKADKALPILLESEALGYQTNAKDDLSKIYQLIAQVYTQNQDFQKALSYSQLAATLRDSILDQKSLKTTAELELKYNFDKQELEMTRQQLALRESELKNQSLRNQILLISTLGLSFILLMFAYIWRRRQLHRQKILMLEKEKETQRLRSIITGEENERKRIARELHDGIGVLLSTVKMQFNSLSNNLPNIKNKDRFQKAEDLLDDACDEVRRISHNMMPGVLEHYGLEFALQQLCLNIEQSSELDIEFIPFELESSQDETLNLSIYRIIQELLKNVVQHAKATEVIVQLTLEDKHLFVVVEDNGQGFQPNQVNQNKGIGLDNIRSRVAYLNGRIDIQSDIGQGSSFMIDIPLLPKTEKTST